MAKEAGEELEVQDQQLFRVVGEMINLLEQGDHGEVEPKTCQVAGAKHLKPEAMEEPVVTMVLHLVDMVLEVAMLQVVKDSEVAMGNKQVEVP